MPGTRSKWALGPWRVDRPALLLRHRIRPASLRGGGIWIAPFAEEHVIIYRELFHECLYNFDLVPFSPDLVIDCGAHIGGFTALAAAHYPEPSILAFEPDSTNYWFLQRQRVNRPGRLHLFNAAVGVSSGQIAFVEVGHWSHARQPNESRSATSLVNVMSLPDLLKQNSSTRLLLKMDIEGAELELLPEVVPLLPGTTALFLECHGGTSAWETCRDLLHRAGFKILVVRRRDVDGVVDMFVESFAVRD